MPPAEPVSPAISARIIHASLVLGVLLFWVVAWYVGATSSMPFSAVPSRPVLYIGLTVISAILFGAAMYYAARLTPAHPRVSQDEWWRVNMGRAVGIWALVEAPTILGTAAYLITNDFRTLLAPFTGLLLFVNYRPSRLVEG